MSKVWMRVIVMVMLFGICLWNLQADWFANAQNQTSVGQPPAKGQHRVYYRNKVIVLMYHDVSNSKDIRSLSLAKFSEQLQLMKDSQFNWITMDQYKQFVLHGARLPNNAVLLTFDDGYRTFYTDTYPVLRKFHAPATNFLIVGTISNPEHLGVPKLTWDQVREMHRNGYDFYSHTFDSHYYLPIDKVGKRQLPELMSRVYLRDKHRREDEHEYESRVTRDLQQANQVLYQELGIHNDVLAFPFGAFSKPLLRVCDRLGIMVTFTVKKGLDKAGQRNGFRLNAGGSDDDPQKLLVLMEKAKSRLRGSHYGIVPNHQYYKNFLAIVFAIAVLVIFRYYLNVVQRRRSHT